MKVTTVYSDYSDAKGALLNFVSIDNRNDIDFTKSALLALDRNISHDYTLPFNLFPGQYIVLCLDIEHNGTLFSGVGYPAGRDELVSTQNRGR